MPGGMTKVRCAATVGLGLILGAHAAVPLGLAQAPAAETVTAIGEGQSYQGWRRLEAAVATSLRELEVASNPQGAGLLLVGLMMAVTVLWQLASDPQAITQAFFEMMRF